MRLLAVDYGLRRTGLAWTDPFQMIATGIGSLDTPKLEGRLKEIMAQEEVEAIILGYPTKMDGSDTDATEAVRGFAKKLKEWFPGTRIELWDERFTSKQAKEAMIRGGVKKKKRSDKYLINEVSAVLILQDYLDSKMG